nr:hypothetical protein [Tanacetum cinerariifolium]
SHQALIPLDVPEIGSNALNINVIDTLIAMTKLGMIFNEFNRLSGIDDDLEYEWKISYEECEKIYAEAVILINKRLVRLINVTVEQWLDLKYGNHKTIDINIKKGVIVTITKVIKEEFEKLESLKISDDSFTCNTSFKTFHKEFNRMSRMDDDLFAYEVEIPRLASVPYNLNEKDKSEQPMTHGSDVDMEYDPSNTRGDDEVELTDKESFDSYDDDEVDKIFRIDTNWNKDILWVHEKPWTDNEVWEEPTPVKHYCEPFSFKSRHLEWPTFSWIDEGYCNGRNLPGAYIVGNTLHYQNLEWYEALEDTKLKDKALKIKSIMEGMINKDDESHNEGWRR